MAWNEPGGNDPWGNKNRGGKNNNGNQPPDLDEALKQLMNKLNSLFGGKKSNGSGSNKSSGGNGGFIGIFVVIIAVTLLFNSVYTLDEQKRGVLLRLGKYQSTEMPGLHFKIPFVDQVIPVNTTAVRTLEIRERMLTEDENIVEVELNAQYRVADPVKFALRIEQPQLTVKIAAQNGVRHEGGLGGKEGGADHCSILPRGQNLNLSQGQFERFLTGMVLTNVNIKDARPPEQVRSAFDDVQVAKLDKERMINEAEAYANAVVPEARGAAQRQIEEARAYRDRVIARAQGEAERFEKLYAEYRKAPQVTRDRLYIDAISEVYNNASKVLVDVEGGNNMMYIPLDKIVKSVTTTTSGDTLTKADISRITDQVLGEVKSRQNLNQPTTIRREGR